MRLTYTRSTQCCESAHPVFHFWTSIRIRHSRPALTTLVPHLLLTSQWHRQICTRRQVLESRSHSRHIHTQGFTTFPRRRRQTRRASRRPHLCPPRSLQPQSVGAVRPPARVCIFDPPHNRPPPCALHHQHSSSQHPLHFLLAPHPRKDWLLVVADTGLFIDSTATDNCSHSRTYTHRRRSRATTRFRNHRLFAGRTHTRFRSSTCTTMRIPRRKGGCRLLCGRRRRIDRIGPCLATVSKFRSLLFNFPNLRSHNPPTQFYSLHALCLLNSYSHPFTLSYTHV
jgi:hypothetical protein